MKEKSHIGIKILCFLLIIIVLIYLYGRYINTIEFKVKEVSITNKNLPSDYNGLKIAQFSDLHYGRTTDEATLKKLTKELNKLNADIIIFTGDLFDNKNISSKDEELMTKYLKELKSKLFKFAVLGDYDEKNRNTIRSILEKSDFTILEDTSKLVYYDSQTPINFIGYQSDISDLINTDYFNILLMHEPDNITKVDNIDIAFAGHSLGGQIRIPFIGGIRKINGANTYIESYYKIKNTELYISNGIGTQDLSFRLFNAPSITLYRLYNK